MKAFRFVVWVVGMTSLTACNMELLAKDSANLPPEVLEGWRKLAQQSSTYSIFLSQVDSNGKNMFNPGVLSRLDNRYAKYERLDTDSKVADWPRQITEALLYDGTEYYTLLRPVPTAVFSLAGTGNNRGAYNVLSVGAETSTIAASVDLLSALESDTVIFTKFERRNGENEGVYLSLEVNDPKVARASDVVAKLDPEHDFRVISAIQTFDSAPYSRNRIEYKYGDHLAIASEELLYTDTLDRLTNNWVQSVPERPALVTRRHLIADSKLDARQFSIEHYGLPAFRKRNPPIWPMLAMIVGGVGLVLGAIRWLRRSHDTD